MREHLRIQHRNGLPCRLDVLAPETTEVMLALLCVYARDKRATVRAVAAEADRSLNRTYEHLHWLEAAGLVAMGEAGSLRPLVHSVPFGQALGR